MISTRVTNTGNMEPPTKNDKEPPKKNDNDSTTRSSLHDVRTHTTEKALLLPGDMDAIVKLSANYNRIMELKQLETLAMFRSAKQTARASIAYISVLFILGTAFVKVKADVPTSQAILFSVYTFTSAGFRSVGIPKSSSFLTFVVFYVFAGISALAILVAQTFQYLELQASRWNHMRDRTILAAEGLEKLNEMDRASACACTSTSTSTSCSAGPTSESERQSTTSSSMDQKIRHGLRKALWLVLPPQEEDKTSSPSIATALFVSYPRNIISKFQDMAPVQKAPIFLITILLVGTITMMYLEDWPFTTALYFATFAMTTIGYGDVFPTKESSTWFVSVWLPCNVAFLAVYLGTVAHCYVRFRNWNVSRIETQLKQQQKQQKQQQENNNNRQDTNGPTEGKTPNNNNNNNNNNKGSIHHNHQTGKDIESVQIRKNDEDNNEGEDDTSIQQDQMEHGTSKISSVTGEQQSRNSTLAKTKSIPELLTIFVEESKNPLSYQKSQKQLSHGMRRRERIRQFSLWTGAEKSDFFGPRNESIRERQQWKEEGDDETDDDHDDAKIETTMDLLIQLALTKATGAALLESKKGTADTQQQQQQEQEQKLNILNIRVHFKVLERLARIIASEAKHIDAEIEINGNILAVTMERLQDIAEHWLVPTRAREAFRSVTFASIIFVGEREIFHRGVNAFFNLNPLQFHSIFGPFVVAMEDIDTMIAWLVSTQSLRDKVKDTPLLSQAGFESSTRRVDHILSARRQNRRNLKNKIETYFLPSQGNAVLTQM